MQPRKGTTDKLDVLQCPLLSAVDCLIHGFSTRRGSSGAACKQSPAPGELNLGFTHADDRAGVVANREQFLEAVTGDRLFPVVTLSQVHSSSVLRIDTPRMASDPGIAEADGMMTDRPGILLAIQTADCIPVLVADPKHRAVAAFHAGWRGTVKRIVELGVRRMRFEFGSIPEDLVAAIGPGIGPCCYEVGVELHDEFSAQFSYAAELFHRLAPAEPVKNRAPHSTQSGSVAGQTSGLHLDLVEANRRQLLDAGLNADSIAAVQQCTSCNTDRFFSYRAERGATGRMLSVIGIRSH